MNVKCLKLIVLEIMVVSPKELIKLKDAFPLTHHDFIPNIKLESINGIVWKVRGLVSPFAEYN
jgi:hypothetical protein